MKGCCRIYCADVQHCMCPANCGLFVNVQAVSRDMWRDTSRDIGAATFHGHDAEGLAIYRNVVLS
jgi:hypothetical protein